MTDWTWDYNPSEEYLAGGLPHGVVAEVERLATELAALGHDAVKVGRPADREGGLREFDICPVEVHVSGSEPLTCWDARSFEKTEARGSQATWLSRKSRSR